MKTRSLILILAAMLYSICINTVIAQESGKVDYPQLGLSFDIPESWVGQEGEGIYFIEN